MPRWRWPVSPVSTRAATKKTSAVAPLVMNILEPLIT